MSESSVQSSVRSSVAEADARPNRAVIPVRQEPIPPASLAATPSSLMPVARWLAAHRLVVVVVGDVLGCLAGLAVADGFSALLLLPSLLVVGLSVPLLFHGGYYRPRVRMSVLSDLPGIAGRCFAAGALTAHVLPGLGGSLTGTLTTGAAVAGMVVAFRAVIYWVVRWLRRTRRIAHRTLIIGGGQVAADLGTALLDRPEHGLRPVGFLDSGNHAGSSTDRLPYLGEISGLADAVVDHQIAVTIVAFSSSREAEQVEVLRACDRLAVDILVVPRLFELHTVGRDMDSVWGIPLTRLHRAAFRSPSWKVKRLIDVVGAGAAVLLLLPVLLACAAAARWETGGVFFRQTRVGLDGRTFEMLKFMSMKPVDEADAHRNWSIGTDVRVGTAGRFMRRLSLDELPQLLNVLRGDMSLVGPRPERIYFVELLAREFPRYMARHRVPAGLTGWAQVNGLRGDTSIEERVRFDNYYIENWSLWLDVQILVRTFVQVFRASGR